MELINALLVNDISAVQELRQTEGNVLSLLAVPTCCAPNQIVTNKQNNLCIAVIDGFYFTFCLFVKL